jgi:hypothetical protein
VIGSSATHPWIIYLFFQLLNCSNKLYMVSYCQWWEFKFRYRFLTWLGFYAVAPELLGGMPLLLVGMRFLFFF